MMKRRAFIASILMLAAVQPVEASNRFRALRRGVAPSFTPTNLFGGNLSGPGSSSGVMMYRDLARQTTVNIQPWGFGLLPDGLNGPELSDKICGLDLGCTKDSGLPGSAWNSGERDYSLDIWRVDHKRFAASFGGDSATQTVNSAGQTRAFGRYCGFSGTLPTFSDGGTDGYAQFTDDTTLFNCYSYGATWFGGAIYYKIEVEQGTIEVWDGNPTAGGVLRREITSADNATERACEFGTNLRMYLRRKAGVPTRIKSYICYVKGADCTSINMSVPDRSYAVSINMTYSPGAAFTVVGIGATFTADATAKANGTGVLALTDNVAASTRFLRYFGLRSNEKKFPAGGIKISLPLPSGSTYGTSGTFNKQFIEDIGRLGWRYLRNLDLSAANRPCFRPMPAEWLDGYENVTTDGHTINARLFAELANACGLRAVWPTLPIFWTNAARRAYLTELDAWLNPGIEIWPELSNEVWNSGFTQYSLALAAAGAKGIQLHEEYADRVHEMLDDIDALALSRTIKPQVCWQTALSAAGYAQLMGRAYLGGAGAKLRSRINARSGGYNFAPYFGGGVTRVPDVGKGTMTYGSVTAVTGTGQTQATYYAEIANQYAATQVETIARVAEIAAYVANDNATYGTSIIVGCYEVNRHGAVYSNFEAAFMAAYYQFEESAAMAALQRKHLEELAPTIGKRLTWYSGIAARVPSNINGYWNILLRQGYDATTNRTDSFEQIAAFGQAQLLASNDNPKVPAMLTRRRLFAA